MHGAYLTDILLIIQAVNNGTRAQEEHCFEKGMGANM